MALSDEEKRRIEEEEAYRAAARSRAESEANAAAKKMEKKEQSKKSCLGCLSILVILFVIGMMSSDGEKGKSAPPITPTPPDTGSQVQVPPNPAPTESPSGTPHLNATVRFTNGQFLITNLDDFDWVRVKIMINKGFFDDGYYLDVDRIGTGQEFTSGAMQFANSDGTRFNPFQMKPKDVMILATTPEGKQTIYVATFN